MFLAQHLDLFADLKRNTEKSAKKKLLNQV